MFLSLFGLFCIGLFITSYFISVAYFVGQYAEMYVRSEREDCKYAITIAVLSVLLGIGSFFTTLALITEYAKAGEIPW